MNLITKLTEKLKNFANILAHSKIVKRGVAFALALSIAPAAIACTKTPNPNPDPDPDPTPGKPTPVTPGDDDDYSELLQNVLSSEYYNGLIDKYKSSSKEVNTFKKAELNPFPYGFYKSQGYDLNAIYNDELDYTASKYIKDDEPNALYIATNIETKGSKNYYTNYLLKYNLTKKESADLKMLFEGNYIQASFFLQELSYTQTPTIVSEYKIEINTYNGILNHLNDIEDIAENTAAKEITSFSIEDIHQIESPIPAMPCYSLSLNIVSVLNDSSNIQSCNVANVAINTWFNAGSSYNDCFYCMSPERFTNVTESYKVEDISKFALKKALTRIL